MQFLYPTYLWGFLLVLIPIIIHLFQIRKYRTVYFSSLKFLKQLEIEKKKKSRLRELLLLITRVLLIIMLVLAFAHPYVPGKSTSQTNQQTVGIYLDNSQSMENEADGQSLFNHAKGQAIQTIKNYPQDTRYYFLHNDELFTSRFPLESSEVINNIELLEPASRSSSLGQILERFAQILKDNGNLDNPELYIFSDLQRSFLKPELVPDTMPFITRIMQLPQGNADNLFIDSCWFTSPIQNAEQRHTVFARINNASDRELQRFPVRLLIQDSLVAQETVNLSPYSTGELLFSFNMSKGGWLKGAIEIRDYPVSFDNLFHFVYEISDNIPVLQIFEDRGNEHLRALFDSDPYFDYNETEANAMPYQDLKRFQFIVLNSLTGLSRNLADLLVDYVSQGGSLLVIPPQSGSMQQINEFLNKLQSPVISNILVRPSEARIPEQMKSFYEQISMNPNQQVEWPDYYKYFRLVDNFNNSTFILSNNTGRPLLSRNTFGRGYVTVSAAPLISEFTNFQVHPLFIPYMYYLANTGMEDQELYSRIGNVSPVSVDIESSAQQGPAHIIASDGVFDLIPNQFRDPNTGRLMLYLASYSGPAGVLDVSRTDGPEALIAMNYAREESLVENVSTEEIKQMITEFGWTNISLVEDIIQKEISKIAQNKSKAFSLVRILLLFALVFLILESLIHRYKT